MRNPKSLKGARRRRRAPRQRKQGRQFNAKKIEYQGIEFDSKTEFLYYKHLKSDPAVKDVELQPRFEIITDYKVTCKRCAGSGRRPSPRTGNPIQCNLCSGIGERIKSGAIYTADFKVTYIDGYVEVCDVKGGPVTKDFSLRRRLFEKKTGMELIVVRLKNKEWVRE